jgi:hypothetical protein
MRALAAVGSRQGRASPRIGRSLIPSDYSEYYLHYDKHKALPCGGTTRIGWVGGLDRSKALFTEVAERSEPTARTPPRAGSLSHAVVSDEPWLTGHERGSATGALGI